MWRFVPSPRSIRFENCNATSILHHGTICRCRYVPSYLECSGLQVQIVPSYLECSGLQVQIRTIISGMLWSAGADTYHHIRNALVCRCRYVPSYQECSGLQVQIRTIRTRCRYVLSYQECSGSNIAAPRDMTRTMARSTALFPPPDVEIILFSGK